MNRYYEKNQGRGSSGGYIALVTVLIISAVIILIGVTISLLAISESQMSLSSQKNEKALNFVESCVEEVLLKIKQDPAYSGTGVSLPGGICTVNITSPNPNWTFEVSGSLEGYSHEIEVSALRNPPSISIVSWKQIN